MPSQRYLPLSPHLTIYRWPLTMALSIGHRVTGGALSVALIVLTIWLVALAAGPQTFGWVDAIVRSWLGLLVLFGYTFFLFLHMANGVRHLVWDVGYGFDRQATHYSGLAVLAFAGGMTVLTWLAILILA